ncbi:MAG: TIGR04197 family type VII secretion effector [Streptococcaceae bacterium]|nr:TIGR04197 family type VII secretion effector [Streptococcaceae bacterium]
MTAGKINSNTVDAQEAITELVGIDASGLSNQSVNFGSSNVPSMLAGQTLSNQLMSDVSKVVACVLAQANKFPELAKAIEERDRADGQRFQ